MQFIVKNTLQTNDAELILATSYIEKRHFCYVRYLLFCLSFYDIVCSSNIYRILERLFPIIFSCFLEILAFLYVYICNNI